jgi:uncharacterized protein YciI
MSAKRRFLVSRHPGPAWESKPLRNQAEWEEHAAYMDQLAERGLVQMGGPIGGNEILLVVSADNESEIRAAFAGDPWEVSRIIETGDVRPWTVTLEARQ